MRDKETELARFREKRERFMALTERAISEESDEKFIEILTERSAILRPLIEQNIDQSWVREEDLRKEEKILKRLENIRKKTLSEMENLSKRKNLLRSYHPISPFPSMPAFFEKEE